MANKNIYEQCKNCINKNWRFFGYLSCISEGMLKVKELKKDGQYCAYHIQKYYQTKK